MFGAVPPRIDSLAELAGQVYDPKDPVAVRYREMLAAMLDPKGTAERAALEAKLNTEVKQPTRDAINKLGILSN